MLPQGHRYEEAYDYARVTCSSPESASKERAFSPVKFLLTWGLIVGIALGLTAFNAAVAKVGYEIDATMREIEALKAENERLQLEISRLESLERIEREALSLGLVHPDETRYIIAEVKDAGEEALPVPASPLESIWAALGGRKAQADEWR